jgi:hypothetical protein
MEGYAKKFFAEHRVGLFRRKVPIQKMLEYQKTPLSAPILETINPKFKKLAVKSFKSILKIMSSVEVQPVFSEFASLLETGIRNGGLRDEILIQMCKQVTKCPSKYLIITQRSTCAWVVFNECVGDDFPAVKKL